MNEMVLMEISTFCRMRCGQYQFFSVNFKVHNITCAEVSKVVCKIHSNRFANYKYAQTSALEGNY